MILAVGPFTALPPMIGDTAMMGAPLARSASRMPGTARIGSTLSHGFDGPMMMPARSGADSASITSARGPRRAGAVEADGAHRRPALVAHEVFLEAQRARSRSPPWCGRHRRSWAGCVRPRPAPPPDGRRRRSASRPRAGGRRGRRASPRSPSPSLNQVGPPSAPERAHEGPGLVAPPPAGLLVDHARQRIEHGVDVGRDVQARDGSKSSPVLTTMASRSRSSCASPTASLTPPLPPDSTT